MRINSSHVVLCFLASVPLAVVLQGQTIQQGLYETMPVPASQEAAQKDTATLQSNPFLKGVLIGVRWRELEPARDQYDFSALDRGIAAVRKAGKFYKLTVVPGQWSPEYIYTSGAAAFPTKVINPNRADYGEKISIPVPWDNVYQDRFSRLIRKLGERYASDPSLVAVVLTGANYMGSEMHLPRTPEDVETWKKLGLTSDRLLAVYKKDMDVWMAAFPGKHVCLDLSPSTEFSDRSQDEFDAEIVRYAIEKYPGRFQIQRNTLMGREEMPAQATDPMFKYNGRLMVGYQALAAFSNPARQGTIEMTALNYVRANATYLELWGIDGPDIETCRKVAAAIAEAQKLGYEKYKQELITEGLYRTLDQDHWNEVQEKMRAHKDEELREEGKGPQSSEVKEP